MPQPNIVLIMTDTQGANVVGCYGRPELRTPCIDRLASRGTRYERAYTTQPVCTPARAGLFTGQYPHTAGAWGNHMPLGDTIKTMGQHFRRGGYATAYTGKWHLSGHDYFDTGICPDGWDPDYWYDGKCYLDDLTDTEVDLWRHGLDSYEKLKARDLQPEFTWAHRVTDKAISFIRKAAAGDQPFLAVVSYDEPHGPSTCPPEYVEPFLDFPYEIGPGAHDDLAHKPAHHREWAVSADCYRADGTIRMPLYLGCNSFVDAEIGRVVDGVTGICGDNTVVIFTSDHGDMLSAHRIKSKGPAMYEEITHIPLIIRLPEQAEGRVDDALVSHIDLLPTMLEMAGMDVPDSLEGRSLRTRLEGRDDGADREIMIEFNRYEVCHDYTGFNPIRCWMAGDLKLVVNLLQDMDELYDLRRDPRELTNQIDSPEYAVTRDRMHDALLDYLHTIRDPFRTPAWERRPWRNSRRFGWKGSWRPRPDDGFCPPARDYRTGRPNTGPYSL